MMCVATFPAVCSSLSTPGSEATLPSKPTVEAVSPAGPGSADDLPTSQDDDDALEALEDRSGGEKHGVTLLGTTRKPRTKKSLSVRKIDLKSWCSEGEMVVLMSPKALLVSLVKS